MRYIFLWAVLFSCTLLPWITGQDQELTPSLSMVLEADVVIGGTMESIVREPWTPAYNSFYLLDTSYAVDTSSGFMVGFYVHKDMESLVLGFQFWEPTGSGTNIYRLRRYVDTASMVKTVNGNFVEYRIANIDWNSGGRSVLNGFIAGIRLQESANTELLFNDDDCPGTNLIINRASTIVEFEVIDFTSASASLNSMYDCELMFGAVYASLQDPYLFTVDNMNCDVLDARMDEQTIISHSSYPSSYPDNYFGCWAIRKPTVNSILQIKPTIGAVSRLEDASGCSYDSVRIGEGNALNNPRRCGDLDFNPLTFSNTGYVFVSFETDSSITDTGFKLSYVITEYLDSGDSANPVVPNLPGGSQWFTTDDFIGYGPDPSGAANVDNIGYTSYVVIDKTYAFPQDGFVLAFQFRGEVGTTVQIQIWNYQYNDGDVEYYTHIYSMEPYEIVSDQMETVYITPHVVTENSRLGISVFGENGLFYTTGEYTGSDFYINQMYVPSDQTTRADYVSGQVIPTLSSEDNYGVGGNKRFTYGAIVDTVANINCDLMIADVGGYSSFDSHPAYNSGDSYPNDYSRCWFIRAARPDSIITVEAIDAYGIEFAQYCDYDYVTISQELSATDANKYCGSELFPTMEFTSNYAVVSFVSDGSVPGRGFRIQYSSVTSGGINTTPYWTGGNWTGNDNATFWSTDDPDVGEQGGLSQEGKIALGLVGAAAGVGVMIAIVCRRACMKKNKQKKSKVGVDNKPKPNDTLTRSTAKTGAGLSIIGGYPTQGGKAGGPPGPPPGHLPPISTQYPGARGLQPNPGGYPAGQPGPYPGGHPRPYPGGPQPMDPAYPPSAQPFGAPPQPPPSYNDSISANFFNPSHPISTTEDETHVRDEKKKKKKKLRNARSMWKSAMIPEPAVYIEPNSWRVLRNEHSIEFIDNISKKY